MKLDIIIFIGMVIAAILLQDAGMRVAPLIPAIIIAVVNILDNRRE